MRSSTALVTAFAMTLLIVLAACTPQQPGAQGPRVQTDKGVTTTGTYVPKETFDPNSEVTLKTFSSEEELKAFLSNTGGSFSISSISARAEAAPMAMDSAVGKAAGGSYSTTNNQVASVDEGDIIKTDGKYIYTISGNTLFIVSAGSDASIVKTMDFPQAPRGLFIDGDRLVIFGDFYDLDYFKSIDFVPRNGMTFLNVYDMTDREDLKLLKEYKFEGTYSQSRMHDGKAYLVVQSSAAVSGSPMPYLIEGASVRQMPVTDIAYLRMPYSNVQFNTIHAVNLQNLDSAVSSKAIATEYGTNLYMSEKNIYLASTQTINEWEIREDILAELIMPKLTDKDKALVEKIKNTDNEVLSQYEKRQKINQIIYTYQNYLNSNESQALQEEVDGRTEQEMEKYETSSYTVINRIDIANGVSLAATNKIPGTLNNQFAMDEQDGILRVATTLQPTSFMRPIVWEKPSAEFVENSVVSTNNVYTLDKDLNIVGSVKDLAPGEQIYSTRFIGDRLYMVTFRQVDPFFVIDLSDAKNPKVLGKLKVPGFSRYLHPYDEHTIIGIGRDATSSGRQQGLKISLFDVTDVEKPKELAKWVASDDYAQSTAEWEHKAFLFDKEKQLLVIPGYSYNYDYVSGGKQQFNGAMVFKVTPSQITMRGIVDHSQGQQYWGPQVERSLWIDDLLYTKSQGLLRVNSIETLKSVANVTLTSSTTGPYPVY